MDGMNIPQNRLVRFLRRARMAIRQWIFDGAPLIPNVRMSSRDPSFVLLVLVVFVLGMIMPEILGLTHPYPQSGLPPASSYYNAAQ